MASKRTVSTVTSTRVHHLASPSRDSGENGPHLGDLREFVTACDGLPDDVLVCIDTGHLSESGRHDVTFTVTYKHPVDM